MTSSVGRELKCVPMVLLSAREREGLNFGINEAAVKTGTKLISAEEINRTGRKRKGKLLLRDLRVRKKER